MTLTSEDTTAFKFAPVKVITPEPLTISVALIPFRLGLADKSLYVIPQLFSQMLSWISLLFITICWVDDAQSLCFGGTLHWISVLFKN